MTNERERQEHQAHWRRALGKPADAVTEEARRAAIRKEIEAEFVEHDAQRAAAKEREEGKRSMEHSMRHARAVTAPRDPRPGEPVGTRAKAADGTVWRRET